MSYVERLKFIRKINSLFEPDRRVGEWESKVVGQLLEDFGSLDEMSKSCVFEYLLFRGLGKW
jgi:hypothetical protein